MSAGPLGSSGVSLQPANNGENSSTANGHAGLPSIVSSSGQEAEHCNLSRFTDIKQWFVAVIKPDFRSNDAQQALGYISSPRTSSISSLQQRMQQGMSLSREEMEVMHQGNLEHNRSPDPDRLQRWCCDRWFSPLQPGSVRSSSAALAATALGSGSLALPYAFSLTGLGLGIITILLAGCVSSLSLQIIMIAARYTNRESYSSILWLVARSRVISFLLDFTVILNGIGAITCILIFEGDFIPSIISSPPWGAGGFLLDRRIAVVAAAIAVYPLTIPADISALRYTSVIIPVVLLITIAIVWSEVPSHLAALHEAGDEIIWFNWDLKSWLKAVPIMVNAYCNQQNAVPAAFALTQPSVARIVKATIHGNFVVTLVLVTMGIGGYLCWGPHTKGDFILNFADGGNTGIWICRVLLAISVYFVIPVALQPASKSCAQIVLSFTSRGERREVSRALHVCSSTFCLCMCTGVAVATNNISSVIGVLGGILATSVMFWFPFVIYVIALWPTQPRCCRHLVAASICFLGVCGFVSVGLMFVN